MPGYRMMYYTLCAGVSAVLDDMQERGEFPGVYYRLEALFQEAENIYIETADVIRLEDRLPADEPNEG